MFWKIFLIVVAALLLLVLLFAVFLCVGLAVMLNGNANVALRENHYGFSTVAPKKTDSKFRCFRRMLGCSFIYMPCGWQADKCSRKAFAWAEFLGKKVIFEEDGRCR